METIMSKKEKERAVLEEMLTKEFLSQCQTEQDVSKFLKKSHAQVAGNGDIRSLLDSLF